MLAGVWCHSPEIGFRDLGPEVAEFLADGLTGGVAEEARLAFAHAFLGVVALGGAEPSRAFKRPLPW